MSVFAKQCLEPAMYEHLKLSIRDVARFEKSKVYVKSMMKSSKSYNAVRTDFDHGKSCRVDQIPAELSGLAA